MPDSGRIRYRPTERGIALERGGATLSEILREPAATHSVFDALAAAIVGLAPNPRSRVGVLGFAGGGLVAPLRAMGWSGSLQSVDHNPSGAELFHRMCGAWAGRVDVAQADAVRWLRRRRRPFDLLIDDLSVLGFEGETKPPITLDPLPRLIRARLRPGGVAVVNLLPMEEISIAKATRQVRAPWPSARLVRIGEHDNQLLVAGDDLPSSRGLRALLSQPLRAIGSEISIQVRSLGAP